jgi:hypothetical protein
MYIYSSIVKVGFNQIGLLTQWMFLSLFF